MPYAKIHLYSGGNHTGTVIVYSEAELRAETARLRRERTHYTIH